MTSFKNRAYVFGVTIFAPLSVPLSAIPATSTWIAESPEQNMNTPENWTPTGVPSGVIGVIFDSAIGNVDLNPTQSEDNFSVCSVSFPNNASLFTVHFNNWEVALNGLGITGTQTNATMNVTNTDNPTTLGNQFSLNRNNNCSTGSAALTIVNTSQVSSGSVVTLGNMDNQFFVQGPFSMLNGGSLSLTNIGNDSSDGTGGNQISFMTAYQAQLMNTNAVEDNVTISLSNSGTYSGNNTLTGNNVGLILSGQYYNTDAFISGDTLEYSVTNNGVNSGTSEGSSSIGVVGGSQVNFGNTCSLGDSNAITISNYGENSGDSGNIDSNVLYVGYIYEHQLFVNTQFVAGDDFSLTATNVGVDSGNGSGQTNVGSITTNAADGDQVMFNNSCIVGKHAAFVTENRGTCSGNKEADALTTVGQLNSSQMIFNGEFQADDFLNFSITNTGTNSSQSVNTNSIGSVSSSQLAFNSSVVIQDNATISVSNQGIFSGNTANPVNYAGVIGTPQFKVVGNFESGDSFSLQIENDGEDTGSGAGSNLIGSVGAQQAYFQGTCSLGDDANIVISNTGTNSNESTANQTGYVNLSQLEVSGNFLAGTNANISITNSATNTGDETNSIGYVSASQALFNGTVTLGDGSVISATNTGTVEGTQISLNQGFTVASGKITIQVINEGRRVSDIGFLIEGANSGGNANIILEDVRLDIDTSLPTFMIGELNGDGLSIVKSTPTLIINTDSSTNGVFSGIIENLSIPLLLTKQGPGSQTLSGINTYTGLTTIQEGILSINGSVVGDVTVNSGGTLKGSGTIGGEAIIENGGVISPGNSIGTITLGSLVLNSGSTTVIEIGPTASSKIIVTGSASVDGALQIIQGQGVIPRQGSFEFLTADPLTGVFSSINTIPGFTFDLSYVGNDIFLNYSSAIPTQGLHGNSLKVANYLNAEAASSSGFMSLIALSGDELQQALKSISPSRNAFGAYITAQTAFSLSNLVSSHMDGFRFSGKESSQDQFLSALTADATDSVATPVRSKGPKNKFSAWISGFGEFAHQTASQQNPSFNFISEAVLAGLDYRGEDRGLAGGSLGYAHTHYYEDNHAGHGNINSYFGSVYGNYFIEDFYLSPAVWGLFNDTDNTRNISFPGYSEKAHANIFAWQLVPHLEVGYDVEFSWGDIIPFTSADWAISWQRGYQEHGASPFNAAQKASNSSMVRSETGLKFSEKWEKSWGAFFLREKASYVFEKPFGTGTVNTSFVGTPSSFTVTAVNQNLNLGSVGLNFIAAIGKQKPVKVDLGYEGEFGSNYWSSQVNLTFSKDF